MISSSLRLNGNKEQINKEYRISESYTESYPRLYWTIWRHASDVHIYCYKLSNKFLAIVAEQPPG